MTQFSKQMEEAQTILNVLCKQDSPAEAIVLYGFVLYNFLNHVNGTDISKDDDVLMPMVVQIDNMRRGWAKRKSAN